MTLSSRGPAQYEEFDASEPDDSWFESLGWRTGGTFLGFVLLAGAVGWWIMRGHLVGNNNLAIAVVFFCGFVLISGGLALLVSWLVFRLSREESACHEWGFVGTLATVGAFGLAGVLVTWPAAEASSPSQSIAAALEHANEAYIQKYFGLEDGFDITPIVFVVHSLEHRIHNYKDLAESIDGEEHLVINALVTFLEEINQCHMAYLQRVKNYDQIPEDVLGLATDPADIRRRQWLGDEAVAAIERFDIELERLPDRLAELLRDADIEGERAAALVEHYTQSVGLSLQRRVLAAELDVINASLQVRSFISHHHDVELDDLYSESKAVSDQYNDYFNQQHVKNISYLKAKADLYGKIKPDSEEARPVRKWHGEARMDFAGTSLDREMMAGANEFHVKLGQIDMNGVLWPEAIQKRDQIKVRRAAVKDLLKSARSFLDQQDSLPDRLASQLRRGGFSEQQIEEKLRDVAAKKPYRTSKLYAKQVVRQIELEFLALYDEQFGEWYRDAQGYAVFKSPDHQARFITLKNRMQQAHKEVQIEMKRQFEFAPGVPLLSPQKGGL